jgi:NitT/TauT family transport system permease protein
LAAYEILQAGFQINIPRLFAALALISVTGIALFVSMDWLSKKALGHWHESTQGA